MSQAKQIYIIAGPNGAGKTTRAISIIPSGFFDTNEFVNADEIARGISPFNPSSADIKAAKIMLERIDDLINQNMSFAIETTLSGKHHVNLIENVKKKGYIVTLLFFYLNSEELAQIRVKDRVSKKGHNIPEDVIVRRYYRGINNLINLYLPIVNFALIYDNSGPSDHPPLLIAEQSKSDLIIHQKDLWKKINEQKLYDKTI